MLERAMTVIKEAVGLRTRRSDVVDFVDQRSRVRREEHNFHRLLNQFWFVFQKRENSRTDGSHFLR